MIYEIFISPFRNQSNGLLRIDSHCIHDLIPDDPDQNRYGLSVCHKVWDEVEWKYRHLKAQDYERIRRLSQVSHQIRKELGILFWRKTYVDMSMDEGKAWELICQILRRPLISPGVKKLRMDVAVSKDESELNQSLIPFFNFAKTHFVLDEFEFCVEGEAANIRRLIAAGQSIAWIRAIKNVKSKNFGITVQFSSSEDTDEELDDSDFERLGWEDGFEDNCYNDICDEMGSQLGDTLCPVGSLLQTVVNYYHT